MNTAMPELPGTEQSMPPPPADEPGFRVAIFSAPADREPLAGALRGALRLTEIDARIRARSVPGILPERLSRADADRLVELVGALGLDAEAVLATDLPDLRHAPKAHHVRCAPTGLEIVPAAGDAVERVAWERVAMLSVADVPLDEARHHTAPRTVMFRGMPGRNEADTTTVVRGPELWLVLADPFGVLHIDHREMNYEYLGPRKSGSAAANFREFLADLRRAAPQALLTPAARAFLARDSVEKYRLETPERHREMVELYAALARRNRRPQSAAGRLGKEIVMDPAVVTASSDRLVELHHLLRTEIDQLQLWLKESDEYGRPQFGQMGDRVQSLRDVVAEHFALEDDGGYMAGPLSVAPELAERAAALHADHPRLLAEFAALADALRECPCRYDCWSAARRDFQQLLERLELHEHRENELWQEAFEAESGPGD
jgi:hypothetical protein